MVDTHSLIVKEVQRRYAELSGEERFTMGARMFDAAKIMAIASFGSDLMYGQIREKLFLRFYGNDFDEKQKRKIIRYLT